MTEIYGPPTPPEAEWYLDHEGRKRLFIFPHDGKFPSQFVYTVRDLSLPLLLPGPGGGLPNVVQTWVSVRHLQLLYLMSRLVGGPTWPHTVVLTAQEHKSVCLGRLSRCFTKWKKSVCDTASRLTDFRQRMAKMLQGRVWAAWLRATRHHLATKKTRQEKNQKRKRQRESRLQEVDRLTTLTQAFVQWKHEPRRRHAELAALAVYHSTSVNTVATAFRIGLETGKVAPQLGSKDRRRLEILAKLSQHDLVFADWSVLLTNLRVVFDAPFVVECQSSLRHSIGLLIETIQGIVQCHALRVRPEGLVRGPKWVTYVGRVFGRFLENHYQMLPPARKRALAKLRAL